MSDYKYASIIPLIGGETLVMENVKEVTLGPWKGKTKLATMIQHKKAYESSQTNLLEDLFG